MKPKDQDDFDDDELLFEEDFINPGFKKWVPKPEFKTSQVEPVDLFIGKKIKSSEVFEYQEE